MPHSPEEKKRVVTRLRRIQGQALALERAVNEGTECGALLQQLAALRGAATGLMAEVLESHLRETFLQSAQDAQRETKVEPEAEIDLLMRLVRSYLK
ncbi:metal-sensing transcriptional repressor [Achromobacter denitrificans]|uniref:metal-sensing transcriptional repressor n=1 Tax=Achromobacter denitrificans TaxID=32002 RepID=UPI0023E7CC8F|nr:metal-sensing transcriptional repressor [Achromobacter denitrificans]MDF3850791.1 metal-sensing transcriptional repressor [Achromobacter denitrificans]